MSNVVDDPAQASADDLAPSKSSLIKRSWIFWTFLIGLGFVLTSFSPVRGLLAYPLYVHDKDASGEYAYVMADGLAYYERLVAAADLYHHDRVAEIVITDEQMPVAFDHHLGKNPTRRERAQRFLVHLGVPDEKIQTIPQDEGAPFGSLSEATSFAGTFPNAQSVVVVTSAPHTRRSRMCFHRAMPADCQVTVFSASAPALSWEIHSPLWMEYVKMLVYWVVA